MNALEHAEMQLDVVNASIAEPVLQSLTMSTTKAEALVAACCLDPGLLERAEGLIPLHSGEKLLARAHELSDDPCFAFNVVERVTNGGTGAVANIPVSPYRTALDGVRSFVQALDGALTGTKFYLEFDGEHFWILRTTDTTAWSDTWPLIQYNLGVMLNGVRRVLGPGAMPNGARIAAHSLPHYLPSDLVGIAIETGALRTGLRFSRSLLLRQVRSQPLATNANSNVYSKLKEVGHEQVALTIRKMLASESTDLLSNRVARAFGISSRTYQRSLQRMGTTHSRLVADSKLSMAIELLGDPAWSITHISYELGYSYPGDFTRFFKARTGTSPREFRAEKLTVAVGEKRARRFS